MYLHCIIGTSLIIQLDRFSLLASSKCSQSAHLHLKYSSVVSENYIFYLAIPVAVDMMLLNEIGKPSLHSRGTPKTICFRLIHVTRITWS